jgi:hypothetical protein
VIDLAWRQGDLSMLAFGRTIGVSCDARNELNGRRGLNEVVFSTQSDGSPGPAYQPRVFPVGLWSVGRPTKETDPYLAPWFIPTDAWQVVDEWSTVERDGLVYVAPVRRIADYAYGLHCSTSLTTLGCLRIDLEYECRRLVDSINRALGERAVTMEVSA